jgi:hypothetical protein
MRLLEIRNSFNRLWRLMMGPAKNVLGSWSEVNDQPPPSVNPIELRTDVAHNADAQEKQHHCATEIAAGIVVPTSGVTVSSVLVIGAQDSTPLKRTKIHFDHPEQVHATLDSLTAALEKSGFDFRTVWNSTIPATEIWLTSPLKDQKTMLLSCPVRGGEQVNTAVVAYSSRTREIKSQHRFSGGGCD